MYACDEAPRAPWVEKERQISMAGQKSVVPADCTSDGRSRATARGKSGKVYYRTLLGVFEATRGRLLEYHVSHVPWRVWVSTTAGFEGDAGGLYGVELGLIFKVPQALHSLPMVRRSLFSEVTNSHGRSRPRIESDATSCGVGTLRWRMRFCFAGFTSGEVIERRGFALKDLQSARMTAA